MGKRETNNENESHNSKITIFFGSIQDKKKIKKKTEYGSHEEKNELRKYVLFCVQV